MASIPQFYSDYNNNNPTTTAIFGNDFCELPPHPTTSSTVVGGVGALWGEENQNLVPSSFDDFGLHHAPSSAQYSSDPTSFQMPTLPELNIGQCQNFCLGCQPDQDQDHHLFEFRDDCFSLVPEINPLYHPLPPDNWEIQSSSQVPMSEDSNMKVGRYSEEVRKERILRYLKKRNQRNFNKTIKYACRKTLADRRIRVRGRFARNNEACDQELNNHPTKNNINIDNSIHNHDVGVQMKKDEEEWLQEITSLMYLPYITS